MSTQNDYFKSQRKTEIMAVCIECESIAIHNKARCSSCEKKHNNRLGGRIGVYEMEFWKTWEVDSIEDKELCEWYFNKRIL